MRLTDALNLYLVHRVRTHPRSYKDHATTLFRFESMHSDRDLASIRRNDIIKWRDEQTVSAASRNQYINRLRAFFRYALREGWIEHDPTVNIDRLREDKPRQIRIGGDKFPLLVQTARHPRDRALIALSLELLLRGAEITRLRVGDVDLTRRLIRVMVSKGKDEFDEDEMAISRALAAELAAWLRYYRGACGLVAPDAPLFPSLVVRRSGTAVEYRVVEAPLSHPWNVVRYALARCGEVVEEGTGFHAIRRSAARVLFDHLIQQDQPYDMVLTRLSALMHHSSRATTERYLGVAGDRVLRNRIIHDGGDTPLTLAMATVDETTGSVSALPDVS